MLWKGCTCVSALSIILIKIILGHVLSNQWDKFCFHPYYIDLPISSFPVIPDVFRGFYFEFVERERKPVVI